MRNSTIRQKTGTCSLCTDNKEKPLTKGLCGTHYWGAVRLKSVMKQEEKEVIKDEDVATLVGDLDIVFSRYIRLKDADLYGKCTCISCGKKAKWTTMDCGHFIPRQHLYTRFSEMNCHPQCQNCNRYLRGNIAEYAKALELIRPGTVEVLQEHSRIIYKYERDELKTLIADYIKKTQKLNK